MTYLNSKARQRQREPDDFRQMLHWDDASLQRVHDLKRELESRGMSRTEAARKAAGVVRRERRGRAA